MKINFTDYNPMLIENFWQSYITLPVDTTDIL